MRHYFNNYIKIGVIGIVLTALLIGCESGDRYSIKIISPSDENAGGGVTPGHGFFITGSIAGKTEIPQGAELRVSVMDKQNNELRFAYSNHKNNDTIDRFCDAFFYYYDADPSRSDIRVKEFPCLIVDDADNPKNSIRNANIKCWFSDNEFNAFIPYATDKEHGLLIDDGIGYVDEAGNPYDALPYGDYTATAVLKNAEGKIIGSAKKSFKIKSAETTLLCRFHPDSHYINMKKFAEKNKFAMNIDYLPGYYRDRNGNDKGGLRAMFIGANDALYNGSRVVMFEYLSSPTSSSLTIELPYIEKYFNIDDPKKFTVYHYDIGEPDIIVDGKTVKGKIIAAKEYDKLALCRADIVKNVSQGIIDFNTIDIYQTDTNFADGITLRRSPDYEFAVAGLVVPHQLQDDDILFDPAKNETGLLNRTEKIVYIIWDGTQTRRYEKPVTLTRTFKDGSVYDSILEFYHIFSKNEIDPSKDYEVSLYGIDKYGVYVDGTKEHFVINKAPQAAVTGTVDAANINRYGNVSFGEIESNFRNLGFEEGDMVSVQIGRQVIDMPFVTDYQDVRRGCPLLVGLDGQLYCWNSMGSFAETYKIAERDTRSESGEAGWILSDELNEMPQAVIRMKEKAGYLEEYVIKRKLAGLMPIEEKRENQTIEEFVNFRQIATTGIKPNTLYRSSSPIAGRINRQTITDQCIRDHKIDHVINLYDTKEKAESYDDYKGSYVSSVNTVYIHMSLDYTSKRFSIKLAEVLSYIADNPGKYVLHCILGEHRTGATCMLIEALMGASYDEITKDYMQTYINLYDVKPNTKQYDMLVDDNVNAVLQLLFNIDNPRTADLRRLAADFVLSAGLTEQTLDKFRKNLSL